MLKDTQTVFGATFSNGLGQGPPPPKFHPLVFTPVKPQHLHSGALQKHRNNAVKHNGRFIRHAAVTFAVRAMRLFTTPPPLYSATGSYSGGFNAGPCNSKEPSDSVSRRWRSGRHGDIVPAPTKV